MTIIYSNQPSTNINNIRKFQPHRQPLLLHQPAIPLEADAKLTAPQPAQQNAPETPIVSMPKLMELARAKRV